MTLLAYPAIMHHPAGQLLSNFFSARSLRRWGNPELVA
jgi:hypothetical protein